MGSECVKAEGTGTIEGSRSLVVISSVTVNCGYLLLLRWGPCMRVWLQYSIRCVHFVGQAPIIVGVPKTHKFVQKIQNNSFSFYQTICYIYIIWFCICMHRTLTLVVNPLYTAVLCSTKASKTAALNHVYFKLHVL